MTASVNPKRNSRMQWYRMDLHLHTPGSADYQEPGTNYLDILRRAELRGLDVIAFTDHNTVNGYRAMIGEIEQLEMLSRLDRATPEERRRLADYRRLLDKILVLPGFEFTATFGFHILGVFSPDAGVRRIEHVLLALNIPPETLDEGSSNVGASSDVLSAYRAINDAGGIVIAAHVNSTHGVAMRNFDFGGQTRIAYTQDPFLHALEVTDLESSGRSATTRFFDGRRAEYPRRMRCVQGSDAHRLIRMDRSDKNLGIGDRTTEIMLPERTFEAIREVFQSADYALTRPYRGPAAEVYDTVQIARENGATPVTAFHPILSDTSLPVIAADVCGMANCDGGIVYVGVSADPTETPHGIESLSRSMDVIRGTIERMIVPRLPVHLDALETQRHVVIRLQVQRGEAAPYAIEGSRIYVRSGAETILAPRDRIVELVMRSAQPALSAPIATATATARTPVAVSRPAAQAQPVSTPRRPNRPSERPDTRNDRTRGNDVRDSHDSRDSRRTRSPFAGRSAPIAPTNGGSSPTAESDAPPPRLPRREPPGAGGIPRNGVEIIGTELRKGEQYHIMRDLRNGNVVKDVTRNSAQKLWQYAIVERETHPIDPASIRWSGDIGLVRRYQSNGSVRYDLAMRDKEANTLRIFYGVTDTGLTGPWLQFAAADVPIIQDDSD